MQSLQAYPQQFSRFGFIISGLVECAQNHLSFDYLEWRADRKRDRIFVANPLSLLKWIRRKMMSFDLFAGANNDGTFNDVAKLAHVSRPGMKA